MSAIIPTPRGALPPLAEVIRPDGTRGLAGPGGQDEILPRVVPSEGDALMALFRAFPGTVVLSVVEGP